VRMQMALDIGPWIVAVDPGTLSLGVCLSSPGGQTVRTWSVRTPKSERLHASLDARLRFMSGGVAQVFDEIYRSLPPSTGDVPLRVEVVVEDGVYRSRQRVIAQLGEVRGIVFAAAFRRGWPVRRMVPIAWKNMLTKEERSMKKDMKYCKYWGDKLSMKFRNPDEVDATHIARKAVSGRR
jgi:Holliday junction resolvasome RuvABC endonuclease subunit